MVELNYVPNKNTKFFLLQVISHVLGGQLHTVFLGIQGEINIYTKKQLAGTFCLIVILKQEHTNTNISV